MSWRQTKLRVPKLAGVNGSSSIITVLVLASAGLVSVGYLLDRSTSAVKMAKLGEQKNQAAQAPMSAAVIARQLVSPGVEDASPLWNTSDLRSNPDYVPRIYVDPYVASQAVIDGSQSPNANWTVMETSPLSSYNNYSWDSSLFAAQKIIKIFTIDANLMSPQSIQDLFTKIQLNSPDISTTLNMPRTTSTVKYTASNCDSSGKSSASWTGYYCVGADITSTDNSVAGSANGVKNTFSFGLLQPPPLPRCDGVTGPSTWTRGTDVIATVKATGVVTGYKISTKPDAGDSIVVADVSGTYTAANGLRTSADVGPIRIPTTDIAAFPDNQTVNLSVELQSPTGSSVTCPTELALTPPPQTMAPKCSFSVLPQRTALGAATCNMTVTNSGGPSGNPLLSADSLPVNGVTWTNSGSSWTTTGISCPTLTNTSFIARLTGAGGSSDCPASVVYASGQLCKIPAVSVGVGNRLMGGNYYCQTCSLTIPNAIVLPSDATNISFQMTMYGVDDWNPCIILNGHVLACNRGEKNSCTAGGPGPRTTGLNRDISRFLNPGSNKLYVESYNKHTYWSMWVMIRGTYITQQATCGFSRRLL